MYTYGTTEEPSKRYFVYVSFKDGYARFYVDDIKNLDDYMRTYYQRRVENICHISIDDTYEKKLIEYNNLEELMKEINKEEENKKMKTEVKNKKDLCGVEPNSTKENENPETTIPEFYQIKSISVNKEAKMIVIVFADGDKTFCKLADGDEWNEEFGKRICYLKHIARKFYGSSTAFDKYLESKTVREKTKYEKLSEKDAKISEQLIELRQKRNDVNEKISYIEAAPDSKDKEKVLDELKKELDEITKNIAELDEKKKNIYKQMNALNKVISQTTSSNETLVIEEPKKKKATTKKKAKKTK